MGLNESLNGWVTANPEAIEELTSEIAAQSKPGPNVEPPTAAMFAGLLERLPDSPPLQGLLHSAANHMVRREVKVGAAVSGFRTALTHYFTSRAREELDDNFSDAELTTATSWQEPFIGLERDLHKGGSKAASYLLNVGLVFLDAVTPVMERSLILETYAQLAAERFTEGARVLDYGSSIMLGPLYLMHKDSCAPADFNSVSHRPSQASSAIDLTAETNAINNRPSIFKEFVCVDRFPVFDETRGSYDEGFSNYALSGLRPSERSNPAYINQLQRLMRLKQRDSADYQPDSGVTFQWANFLDPADLGQFKEEFPDPFDIIIMNFVTQELARNDQLMLHAIATRLLQEGGMLIYNHQAYISSSHARPATMESVRYYGSYASKPWRSQSHVLDNLLPGEGLQHMATFYDNRCRDVRLGMGELMVNGASVPIAELVRHA